MKILIKKLFLMLCFSAVAIQAQTYTLEQTAVAGGGISGGVGGVYGLSSTTGQAAAGGAIQNNPYVMTVGFWNFSPLAPTAANALISGRVRTAGGQGVRNAYIVLTDSFGTLRSTQTGTFGYFRFENLPVGQTYVLTIYSKRYIFAQTSQIIFLNDNVTEINFTAEP